MTEPELPSLYDATDTVSKEAQSSFRRWYLVQLIGLLMAALAGTTSPLLDTDGVAPYLIGAGFLSAMVARIYMLKLRPEEKWYDARAAAESSKSLAWRFATRGEPFAGGKNDDALFVARLGEILQDLPSINKPARGAQITDWMRRTRNAPLADRMSEYKTKRLLEQQGWYARSARFNGRRAKAWSLVIIALEFLVGVMAILKIGRLELFGLMSAVSVAVVAWVQARQFETLNRAYSVASHELASILALLPDDATEGEWAAFVDKSEEAISREHKVWRASRIPQEGI